VTTAALWSRLERAERQARQGRVMAARVPRPLEEPYATASSLNVLEILIEIGRLPPMPEGCPKEDPSDPPCYACKAWPNPEVLSDEEVCALVSCLDEMMTANKQLTADEYPSDEPSTTDEPSPSARPVSG
jgi:hypothetical protein